MIDWETEPARPMAVCSGDPRSMGRAQGEQLRDLIRGTLADLERVEPFQLLRPRWMPMKLFRCLSENRAGRLLGSAVRSLNPAMAERLVGIAEGAGVSHKALWLIQAMEAMLGSVGTCTRVQKAPLGGCTAIAVRQTTGSHSGSLLAHNFDYIEPVRPYFAIRETRPEQGFRSLDFLVAPLCGAIDGINEAGLAVSYNYAMTTDRGQPAPTLSMLVSGLLAGCSSVETSITWLRAKKRWGGGLFMIVDAHGDLASIELTNDQLEVRRPTPGRDWITHSNKLRGPSTCAVEVAPVAVFDNRAPTPLRGTNVLESSLVRDSRLDLLMESSNTFNSTSLTEILSDHGPEGVASLNTICMHSNYWGTSACLQLDPVARTLRVSFSSACTAHFQEYRLA